MAASNQDIASKFFEKSNLSYYERIQSGVEVFRIDSESKQNWERSIHKNLVFLPDHPLVKDKSTETVFQLTPSPDMANYYGVLHGGCVGTLVDVITSIAMMTFDDPLMMSVSVTLSIDYFKAIKLSSKVFLKTKINKSGRRLIFGTCEIFDEKMDLCYKASHTKMKMDATQMSEKL